VGVVEPFWLVGAPVEAPPLPATALALEAPPASFSALHASAPKQQATAIDRRAGTTIDDLTPPPGFR
jgi:hypothetical protein